MLLTGLLLTGCSAGGAPALVGDGIRLEIGRVAEVETASTGTPAGEASAPASGAPPPSGVAAPPPAGGGAGGATTAIRGRVVGLVAGREAPLPAARVWTSDGRTLVTGADGQFQLPGGWPPDGAWIAAREGYVTSAVVGMPAAGEVTLHLKGVAGPTAYPPPPPEASKTITGRVVDPAGQPVAGLLVLLQGADGAFAPPALTDAAGRFFSRLYAHDGSVEAGTLVAIGDEQVPWMGLATGVSLAPSETEIDADPADAEADPLVLVAAPHTLRVEVTGAPAGASVVTSVDLVTSQGARLTVFGKEAAMPLAPLPGTRYALSVEANDADADLHSAIYRDELPIDFSAPQTLVRETLLPPPSIAAAPSLASGSPISWGAVEGARGYVAQLSREGSPGHVWEGFSSVTSLPLFLEAPLPSGNYRLSVTAWEAEGLAPRSVASVSRRELRQLPVTADYRRSSRAVRLTI